MDQSCFARLPAELRERIWDLVLYLPATIELEAHTVLDKTKFRATAELRAQSHLALIRVCRQKYSETQASFYASNTFRYPIELDSQEVKDEVSAAFGFLPGSSFAKSLCP